MTSIRESRILKIRNKIITSDDLRKLAKIVWDEYNKIDPSDSHGKYISFAVNCTDSSSFESEDIAIFDENSIIYTKKVDSIAMDFRAEGFDKSINVEIRHGEDLYGRSDIS